MICDHDIVGALLAPEPQSVAQAVPAAAAPVDPWAGALAKAPPATVNAAAHVAAASRAFMVLLMVPTSPDRAAAPVSPRSTKDPPGSGVTREAVAERLVGGMVGPLGLEPRTDGL